MSNNKKNTKEVNDLAMFLIEQHGGIDEARKEYYRGQLREIDSETTVEQMLATDGLGDHIRSLPVREFAAMVVRPNAGSTARAPRMTTEDKERYRNLVLDTVRGQIEGATRSDFLALGVPEGSYHAVVQSLLKEGKLRSEGVRRNTRYFAA